MAPTSASEARAAAHPARPCGRARGCGMAAREGGSGGRRTTASQTSPGKGKSRATRPWPPRASAAPSSNGAAMPAVAFMAFAKVRSAAARGPAKSTGQTSITPAPPTPSKSAPACVSGMVNL